jgi:hypothetical protein
MTVVTDGLLVSLRRDLEVGQRALDAAREEQRRKDTPAARSRVAERRAGVDRVLDLWNAARATES